MLSYRVLATSLALNIATTMATPELEQHHDLQKRAVFEDSYNIFLRKRNAHACIMSIVFIVLFPLGAISLHLPLRGIRVVPFIHAPIQILGLAMMIGGMGLGIDIARTDLHYISPPQAHVVVGLLTTSSVIVFQPALGLWQHWHYKKTGKKSIASYIHRWAGRITILLGWTNSVLGFQLVGIELVSTACLLREYIILGVLGSLWVCLVFFDGLRNHWLKKAKISSFAVRWDKGIKFRTEDPRRRLLKPHVPHLRT